MAARKTAAAKPSEDQPDVEDVTPDEAEQDEAIQAPDEPEDEPPAAGEPVEPPARPLRFVSPSTGAEIDLTPREPSRAVYREVGPTGADLSGFNFPGRN